MHLTIAAVAACATLVQAFKDTSPFLMLSNTASHASLKDFSEGQIHSSIDVLSAAKEFLSGCKSEKYYIISQPQLSASALSKSLPHLQEASTHQSVQSRLALSEVVGLRDGDKEELVQFIKEKCGAKVSQKFVENARYGEREVVTKEYDPMIGGWTESEKHMGSSDPALQSNVLKDIRKFYSYTFILLSTPSNEIDEKNEGQEYQADFFDPVHMDLKRSIYIRDKKTTNQTNTRPLFEKYQFFTPGLFMGLLVGLILLSILSVGLRAIGSLEVSYAAFDKEMGPAAQKKQQ